MRTAAAEWAAELAAWAVPREILAQAPSGPRGFVPEMFAAPPPGAPRSPSSDIAAQALTDGGTVLDVGCGGGLAAFAVTPPATALVGTDPQADMLQLFAQTAAERGVPATTVLGAWPDVAGQVPEVDVVVCHHVLYNVPDLVPFAVALHEHARRRVVIELSERHPQVARSPLWKHFWGLDRPTGPTAELAAEVLREAGLPVRTERFTAAPREHAHPEVEAAFWCRQLALPPERQAEVAALLAELPFSAQRVTLWWDLRTPGRAPGGGAP
jgi:SAM-dependent methyltransferase